MTAEADDDEYVMSYTHRGRKLHVLYLDRDDNRGDALESARRTAQADGVENMRVFRRPRGQWEPVDWRTP